MNHWKIDSGIL